MGRQLPPFAAVRAFEAAARHRSFKKAAEELCLSPSAISHQIRALEEYLDTALFERVGNRLELTLTGRGYAGRLTGLLNGLEDSTRAIRQAGERPLRVLCTPGLAARWLVPRLDRLEFGDRVRLRVSTGAPSTDFASNDSDVVIQWSTDPTQGVVTEPLMQSNRYPVISPHLRDAEGVDRPEDLLRLRLMYDETDDAWGDWFSAAGLPDPVLPNGPVFPNCELATTAAERGQGVSLAYDSVVRGTLASGRLVRLFETVTMPMVIYSVAYPEDRASDPIIRAFRDWLFTEVARDGTGVQELSAAE
ncbi:LysR substrate-binding domain-containing protein [Nioella ostreopsis]|uniref:LysR substrate-binding domain-containing protein n=1 Tax=Nioella ostreopsis TaxID=2448479 RepID=UPI000FD9EC80|nr:LysR substrate-binding domain-containing protein [Nioella ostreopsis]